MCGWGINRGPVFSITFAAMKYPSGLFLVCLFCISGLSLVAQPGIKNILTLGIKANYGVVGIANQNNYGQNEMEYEVATGFGVGIAASLNLSGQDAVIAELNYQTCAQNYDDRFKGAHFAKDVQYQLLSLPLMYRRTLTPSPGGYAGVGAESKPRWYLQGGLQVDKILSPEIDWYLNDSGVDFLTFVLEGGNPNQEIIEAMGAPASDADLFTAWDLQVVLAGGCEIAMTSTFSITAELRGNIGITDLNASDWRLNNNKGVYGASRNTAVGLHIGAHFRL